MEVEHAEAVSQDGQVRVAGVEPETLSLVGDGEGAGQSWNPERLYAAALATCLHQAVVLAASTGGFDTEDSAVRAEAKLFHDTAQGYSVDARLSVSLPGVPAERRQGVVDQATHHCPLVNGWTVEVDDDFPAKS